MALFTNRFFSFLFSRCVDGYNPVQFHDASWVSYTRTGQQQSI
jgi:hypothetical protein